MKKQLGFERKARLFCDTIIHIFHSITTIQLGFERKARLFCDFFHFLSPLSFVLLGFERKARLFCDSASIKTGLAFKQKSWDLSVRLGYFVTLIAICMLPPNLKKLGFERKARLFCDKLRSFVTFYSNLLGFERKACDPLPAKSWYVSLFLGSWDLSVRLGYFVTLLHAVSYYYHRYSVGI